VKKFFDGYYWMFRIVIPGTWCSVLVMILLRIYKIKFFSEYVSGLQAAKTVLGFGIAFGLFFHYITNYPRKRYKFKEIERLYGPIDFLLEICKKCQKHCKIRKSYEHLSSAYFSMLNDDIPSGTRNIVYYFSSIYLMFMHVAFISAVMGSFNGLFLIWRICSDSNAHLITCGLYSFILVAISLFLTRKNAVPEGYLLRMFTIQTDWIKSNENIWKKKLCDYYEYTVVF